MHLAFTLIRLNCPTDASKYMVAIHFWLLPLGGGGGGGGRTRANSVCFTNSSVKIGAFPNATPTSKIWRKFAVGPKRSKTP